MSRETYTFSEMNPVDQSKMNRLHAFKSKGKDQDVSDYHRLIDFLHESARVQCPASVVAPEIHFENLCTWRLLGVTRDLHCTHHISVVWAPTRVFINSNISVILMGILTITDCQVKSFQSSTECRENGGIQYRDTRVATH